MLNLSLYHFYQLQRNISVSAIYLLAPLQDSSIIFDLILDKQEKKTYKISVLHYFSSTKKKKSKELS